MAYWHKMVIRLFSNTDGETHANPGAAYAEFDVDYRTNIDFSTLHAVQARVVVTAQGDEATDNKGIDIYNNTGAAQLCEVTWNGAALQQCLAGSWSTTNMPIVASQITIRDKGSTGTEDITIYTVDLEIGYS